MNSYGNEWMMNIISLKDSKSYIMYSDDVVKSKLSKLLDCYNNESLIVVPAMLRKEIMKCAILKDENS